MRIIGYHGTNQEFDAFSLARLGMNNPNLASAQGIFFAARADTAWDYAHQAARNMIPNEVDHQAKIDDLNARMERALARNQNSVWEKLVMEMEELEANAIHAEPAGARVLECTLDLDHVLTLTMHHDVHLRDFSERIAAAREEGYDAVIIDGISDTPSGGLDPDSHIVVFNPADITIELIHLDKEMDRTSDLSF